MSPTIKLGLVLFFLVAGGFGIAVAIGLLKSDVAIDMFLRTGAVVAILTVVSLAIGAVAGGSSKAE